MIARHWNSSQKSRFLVLGAWNTLFGYGAFAVGFLMLGSWLHYAAIAVLAHALAITQAFLTQRHLVFRSKEPWQMEFLRFNITHLGTFLLGLAGLALVVNAFDMHPILAQGMVLAVTVVVAYIAHSRFSFRRNT